jgi:hypothetical protein
MSRWTPLVLVCGGLGSGLAIGVTGRLSRVPPGPCEAAVDTLGRGGSIGSPGKGHAVSGDQVTACQQISPCFSGWARP